MSIIQRIKNLFKAAPSASSPFAWPSWRAGKPQWQLTNYDAFVREGFSLNALIYAAIMYKARAASSVLLKAYTGDVSNPEQLPGDDPLSMLVARPNRHQSWIEFLMQRIVYLNISGNNYTFMSRGAGGKIEAMYNLRPDRVFILPAKVDGVYTLRGFIYTPEGVSAFAKLSTDKKLERIDEGQALLIHPDDMAHVKLPNPGDPLEGMGYGLSPLAPGGRNTDVDNKVTYFLKGFFDRGMMPMLALVSKNSLNDPIAARLKERWKELYAGIEGWFEPMVLDHGVEIKKLSSTFDEMGFEGIDERNESRIVMPFGVPLILIGSRLGLNRSTYANYQQAQKAFWTDTLLPELKLFEVEDQYFLNQPERNAFVQNDLSAVAVLQGDIIKQTDAAFKMWQMGTPANMAFHQVGIQMQPIPGGDIGYISGAFLPAGSTVNPQVQAPDSVDEDDRKDVLPFRKKKVVR